MTNSGDESGSSDDAQNPGRPAERFQTRHTRADGASVSTSIVRAVAAVNGTPPTDIEPLYDAIDPDALDQLVASVWGNERVAVAFMYYGCRVTVDGTGEIEVRVAANSED